MPAERLVKATAYITRGPYLLVFTDPGYSDLGLIVPGGTCEPGESVEACLHREVAEEAGVRLEEAVRLNPTVRYVGVTGREVLRHCYHGTLREPERVAETFTHVVTGHDNDRGSVLAYRWVGLQPQPPVLAPRLGDGLPELVRMLGDAGL